MIWELSDPTRFNSLLGPFLLRMEGEVACVRMMPRHEHSNLQDNLHGGALLAFIDIALFAASRGFGVIEAGTAVTLDLSVQFRSEEHTSELQSLMRISYAVLCLKKKKNNTQNVNNNQDKATNQTRR